MDTSEIIKLYSIEKWSIKQVADHFQTYPNRIRRILIKEGETLRDKAEAQLLALESGRANHPTQGKEMSEDNKNKLSKALHESWVKSDQSVKDKRSAMSKLKWHAMSEEEQANFRSKGVQKILQTSKEGSKIERFLVEKLRVLGYNVIHHKKYLFGSDEMEIDILLPQEKVVIEIDGPGHFLPIYGEEVLEKRREADNRKSGQVINAGWTMVRLGVVVKNMSTYYLNLAEEKLVKILKDIAAGNSDKHIEVMINDDRL